jgi:hypothetical protein
LWQSNRRRGGDIARIVGVKYESNTDASSLSSSVASALFTNVARTSQLELPTLNHGQALEMRVLCEDDISIHTKGNGKEKQGQ